MRGKDFERIEGIHFTKNLVLIHLSILAICNKQKANLSGLKKSNLGGIHIDFSSKIINGKKDEKFFGSVLELGVRNNSIPL